MVGTGPLSRMALLVALLPLVAVQPLFAGAAMVAGATMPGSVNYAYANYALLCIIMHFYATWKKNEKIKGRFCVFTQKTIMQAGQINFGV